MNNWNVSNLLQFTPLQVQQLQTILKQAAKENFHFEGQNKDHNKDIAFRQQNNTKYFKKACQIIHESFC